MDLSDEVEVQPHETPRTLPGRRDQTETAPVLGGGDTTNGNDSDESLETRPGGACPVRCPPTSAGPTDVHSPSVHRGRTERVHGRTRVDPVETLEPVLSVKYFTLVLFPRTLRY